MRGAAFSILLGLLATETQGATLAVLPARLDRSARAELPLFFDDFLLAAAQQAGDFDVIGEEDIEAILEITDLEGRQRLLACDDWCLADVYGDLGIDKQLVLRIVRLKEGGWLTVGKLMDARALEVEALSSAFVGGDAVGLLSAMQRVVGEVLGGDQPPEVVRPSPFDERLRASPPRGRGGQCRSDDPEDCEQQCLRRHAGSCQTLATMYLMGKGRPAVWGRSAIFYEQACELGAASACNNLGVLHHYGFGVAIDAQRARSMFELACAGGDRAGCGHLSAMLAPGR